MNPQTNRRLDVALFVLTVAIVLALFVIFAFDVYNQYTNYTHVIELAKSPPIDHAALIAYTRSWDLAATKFLTIFLSFLIIFLGSLFVLRASTTHFFVSAETPGTLRGILSITSPGLVMVFLGTVLVIASVYKEGTVNYRAPHEREVFVRMHEATFSSPRQQGASGTDPALDPSHESEPGE